MDPPASQVCANSEAHSIDLFAPVNTYTPQPDVKNEVDGQADFFDEEESEDDDAGAMYRPRPQLVEPGVFKRPIAYLMSIYLRQSNDIVANYL